MRMKSRTWRALLAAVVASGSLLLFAAPSTAQRAVQLVTPYPAVTVQAGKQVTLNLEAVTPARQRVGLAVVQAPAGWQVVLRGGGFVINGIFGAPTNPPPAQLEIIVPADAPQGDYKVAVQASVGAAIDLLTVDVKVSETAPGAVTLVPEFPTLRAASTETFRFSVTLNNNTPEKTTFNLAAEGPEGWVVAARPSSQAQAATVSVDGGGNSTVEVTADPPDTVTSGKYPVRVTAAGGGKSAQVDLEVEVTGSKSLTLTTPSGRLNTKARAGRGTNLELVVRNEGTAPLNEVAVSSTPPSGWKITFDPEKANVAAKKSSNVTARITPSSNAVAGDYVVTLTATSEGTTSDIEVRVTVQPSLLNGLIAIVILLLVVGGIYWVFQKYGRR